MVETIISRMTAEFRGGILDGSSQSVNFDLVCGAIIDVPVQVPSKEDAGLIQAFQRYHITDVDWDAKRATFEAESCYRNLRGG